MKASNFYDIIQDSIRVRRTFLTDRNYIEKTIKNNKSLFIGSYLSEDIDVILAENITLLSPNRNYSILNTNNEIIGFISFSGYNKRTKRIILGYYLEPNYRGKGIINNICLRLIKEQFNSNDVKEILILINNVNEKSICLAQNLGFTLKSNIFYNNKNYKLFFVKK